MMKKVLPVLSVLILGLFWLAAAIPAAAQPPGQGAVINTPTAQPDGRIIYKVKEKDTCLSISLLTGVSIDTLRKNNNLNAECVIRQGQELVLGRIEVSQATATPGPGPTATALLPSPTPFNGNGKVCVLLYDDVNGNAMRDDAETAIPDGAVSLTDRTGKVTLNLKTEAGSNAVCVDPVPEGDYNVSVAVPEGYNPTSSLNYALKVQAGGQYILDFGAQVNSQAAPTPPSEGGRSPLLGILGGILLLCGAGLGLYVRGARGKTK